ncbi:hypothetical protein NKJ73_23600 [Mesorhizobium sp. M0074]|uniref:hypothetical protein n=1 Tax=Mesorhizobium sp. M0074 TaxID=2956869 RepID=UPI003334F068
MTSIWIDGRHMSIRSYGATAKGPRAIVKVVIEVNDPASLGYLLKEIGEVKQTVDREVDEGRKAEREAKKRSVAGRQKPLALPYFGGSGS